MINEEGLRDWFGKSKSKDGKKGWVNVVTGDSCASDKPGEGVPKCVSSAKRASMSKKERVAAQAAKRREDPGQQSKSGAAKPTMVKTDRKTRKEEMEINEAKDKKGKSSGKKDACYHKVKASASVWPSAYASGRLVQCRKKGAKNYGNKSEEFLALPEFTESQILAMESQGIKVEVIDEKAKACWDTHEKVGMKMKGGKMVNDCRPKNRVKEERERVLERLTKPVEEEVIDEAVRVNENGNVYLVSFTWRAKFMMIKLFFPEIRKPTRQEVTAALEKVYPGCMVQRFDLAPRQPGEPLIMAGYQGGSAAKPGPDKNYVKPMGEGYAPGDVDQKLGAVTSIPKKDRDAARDRLLAKAKAKREKIKEAAAWTKKSGKNPEGGLNEKGRKSYERDNPGSDLKAPSKKPGNKRRASFCARMKGMKKKLTSAKTANDPDSRINKSLRAWNC